MAENENTMQEAVQNVPYLSTKELTVGYDGKPLINNINFEVNKGEIVTLIGPNGAGKSTILKSITKYLDIVGGTVYIGRDELGKLSSKDLSYEMSCMLTERLRTELLTCKDIVETGRYPYTGRLGILSDEDHERVRAAMDLVHVWDLRDRDFMQISDGQKQRILLARAICQEPHIIVLDEPTSFLDIRYQIELLDVLRHLVRNRDVGVLMSLHELHMARIISDKVICVKGDRIFATGPAEEIFVPEVINELYELQAGRFDPKTGEVTLKPMDE